MTQSAAAGELVPAADDIRAHARRAFDFDALRPGQLDVIQDVLARRPVITVMPTGAGKSLCYQLPAVILAQTGGFTLVVSPLIALMKDQVDSLHARGIEAAALTSAASSSEQDDILAGIRASYYSLVYVAPERFRSPRFGAALSEVRDRLQLLAIDEAHCISEWGHDFRPDYRRLGAIIELLSPPRLIALTATATPEVRQDIAVQLGIEEPRLHVRGFDRPNLFFAVERVGGFADKADRLVAKIKGRTGGVGLVYAATRKNAERYAGALQQAGMRVGVYHAGLEDEQRKRAQDAFMGDKLDAIVATNAFGMGVDKPDIRVVIHADLPRSPEAYYQEAGRGGRDGGLTDCVLFFNHGDTRLQEFLIAASYPSAEILRGLWKLLREQPELGRDLRRARNYLPGDPQHRPHESVIQSAARLLLRHGLLRAEDEFLFATRPDPDGPFEPLDVESLGRRASVERGKLRTMVEYAYHARCRRQYILDYFGDIDWRQRTQACTGCDNCLGLGQTHSLDQAQLEQAATLLRLIRQLSGRFGRTRLAKIANGTDDDARFSGLPEHGALRGTSDTALIEVMRALEGAGLVTVSRGEYPTLSTTPQGEYVLDGHQELESVDLVVMKSARKSRRPAGRSPAPRADRSSAVESGSQSDDPLDPDVVERLRAVRTQLAQAKNVPAYIIFSNKTLEAIARACPNSEDELLQVSGIGPGRLEAYGELILAAIRNS